MFLYKFILILVLKEMNGKEGLMNKLGIKAVENAINLQRSVLASANV